MKRKALCAILASLMLTGMAEPLNPAELNPAELDPAELNPVIVETVPEKEYLGVFSCTAYCPCSQCCGAWADGIVYTGGLATEGQTIAVDPDVIPLGSVVEINGHAYIAEDIGGGIKGNEIDIFMVEHEAALQWGVQQHEVYLVK